MTYIQTTQEQINNDLKQKFLDALEKENYTQAIYFLDQLIPNTQGEERKDLEEKRLKLSNNEKNN